ncbi:hypothetical protein F5B20DRAFT_546579 [Whalleya microplaca]|nr:hypothetical protein F5B20DRAFT_546579 [Whalleya microplaca]
MSPPSRAQLLQTTHLFIEAFNEFTPESVVRHRSASCIHRLLPATLHAPPRSNAEYAALVGALGPVMDGFTLRFVDGQGLAEPVIDEAARRAVMYLKSHARTPLGVYENEYVWVLGLSEDGRSVDQVFEFADSKYTEEWLPKLMKAVEESKAATA